MLNRITDTLNFQTEALVLRSERQRVIASNIANADTPGYQARDFDFSKALRAATGQSSSAQTGLPTSSAQLATSSNGHLGLNGTSVDSRNQPELNYAANAQTNLDRNTVDMDRERATFVDNTVRFEATLRFLNGQIKTLNTAITGQ